MSYKEKIPARVYRLAFTSNNEQSIQLVKSVLLTLGFTADELILGQERLMWQLMIYKEDAAVITSTLTLFKKLALPNIKCAKTMLKPDDWASKWKRGWKPGRLTKLLDVVPLWHRDTYKVVKGRDYILMDTLLSFGTGLHETTRIVSQFIEDYRSEIGSLLDIGTGTGVLALVALKHKAKKVLAIDIGELSVEAAKKNSKLNKLPFKVICQDIASFKHDDTYDFVAANLVTHDLVKFRRQIVRFVKPNGLLAVSGISLDNWDKFEAGFKTASLVMIKVNKGKQWAGALFRLQSIKQKS